MSKYNLVILMLILLTGCAGGQIKNKSVATFDWDEWAADFKGLQAQGETAENTAQRAKVIDGLDLLARRTPDAESRAMVVNDLCLYSAADGNSAMVRFYNCAETAKFGALVKGE